MCGLNPGSVDAGQGLNLRVRPEGGASGHIDARRRGDLDGDGSSRIREQQCLVVDVAPSGERQVARAQRRDPPARMNDMDIETAQADVRRVYRGGFSGPLVSAVIWAAASAGFRWGSIELSMAVLFLGGMLIFPLSSLVLKMMGGPAFLPRGHPSAALAMQSAFTVPLGLLVAIALGSVAPSLFLPASLIIVGAHYLTFISLYGMRLYGVLAGALVAVGAVAMFALPALRDVSGWIGTVVLLAFSVPLWRAARAKDPSRPHPRGQ